MTQGTISVTTTRKMEMVDITGLISQELLGANVNDGICYLFNPHTTAAVTINEGADPAVRTDIISAIKEIIPFDIRYQHMEGNSPSHVLASLFGCSEVIFIENSKMRLGTWQKIFFCEFDGPRTRKVHWRVI